MTKPGPETAGLPQQGRRPPYFTAVVLVVGLVAVLARLTRFGQNPWYDETFNWWIAKDGIAQAVERIANDFFPPLYSMILAAWYALVPDDSMVALRLPSVVAGLITCLLVYRLLRLALPHWHALAAVTVFVLSPEMALWAQVVRPFAFEIMFITLALYSGAYLALQGAHDQRWHMAQGGIVVGSLGAVYCNHGALFAVASIGTVLGGLFLYQAKGRPTAAFWRVVLAFLLVALLWLPELPEILAHSERSAALNFPDHRPDLGGLLQAVVERFSLSFVWKLHDVTTAVMVILFCVGAVALWRRSRPFALFLLLSGAVFFLVILSLFFIDPVFGRVFERGYWFYGPVLTVAGAGAAHIGAYAIKASGKPLLRGAASGFVLLALVVHARALSNLNAVRWGDWTSAVTAIEEEANPDDIVVTIPWLLHAHVSYYLGDSFSSDRIIRFPDLFRWNKNNIPDLLATLSQAHGGKRVWLFIGDDTQQSTLDDPTLDYVKAVPSEDGKLVVLLFQLPHRAP